MRGISMAGPKFHPRTPPGYTKTDQGPEQKQKPESKPPQQPPPSYESAVGQQRALASQPVLSDAKTPDANNLAAEGTAVPHQRKRGKIWSRPKQAQEEAQPDACVGKLLAILSKDEKFKNEKFTAEFKNASVEINCTGTKDKDFNFYSEVSIYLKDFITSDQPVPFDPGENQVKFIIDPSKLNTGKIVTTFELIKQQVVTMHLRKEQAQQPEGEAQDRPPTPKH